MRSVNYVAGTPDGRRSSGKPVVVSAYCGLLLAFVHTTISVGAKPLGILIGHRQQPTFSYPRPVEYVMNPRGPSKKCLNSGLM